MTARGQGWKTKKPFSTLAPRPWKTPSHDPCQGLLDLGGFPHFHTRYYYLEFRNFKDHKNQNSGPVWYRIPNMIGIIASTQIETSDELTSKPRW